MLSAIILKEARLRVGLSQRQLASRAGTSQAAIARYEKGDVTPSLETIQRLVRACGLDVSLSVEEPLDPHDTGMLEYHLQMTPEDRLRSNDNANAFIAEARRALETSRG